MKTAFSILLLFISILVLHAQDTIRHYDPDVQVPVAGTYSPGDGYYTGHNTYGDEEFAEKYSVTGTVEILGLVAIHTGVEGTSGMSASYNVYNVAASGLPGTLLTSKTVPNVDIPVDGNPFIVVFDSSFAYSDDFFVSFSLGDYTHNNPGTKQIAITHSPDGVRPASDFNVFGRNAIRWHSHSGVNWKDYRTENFQSLEPAVYFSLFPIVEMPIASAVGRVGAGGISAVYPNPSFGSFVVPVHSSSVGQAKVQLFDMGGKLVLEQHTQLSAGENKIPFTANTIEPGNYIVLVALPDGVSAQKIVIQ